MKDHTIIQGVGLAEALREELKDALERRRVATSEIAEFYLVNLLSDFHAAGRLVEADADAIEKPLALLMMEAESGGAQSRIASFRRVGDTALVIAGFFADRVRKTLMDLSYYISMGGGAYSRLSDLFVDQRTISDLYAELADKFEALAEALSLVAPWNRTVASNMELVRIYERWLATGDANLQDLLEECGIDTGEKAADASEDALLIKVQ